MGGSNTASACVIAFSDIEVYILVQLVFYTIFSKPNFTILSQDHSRSNKCNVSNLSL